jgi:hypothetical protein
MFCDPDPRAAAAVTVPIAHAKNLTCAAWKVVAAELPWWQSWISVTTRAMHTMPRTTTAMTRQCAGRATSTRAVGHGRRYDAHFAVSCRPLATSLTSPSLPPSTRLARALSRGLEAVRQGKRSFYVCGSTCHVKTLPSTLPLIIPMHVFLSGVERNGRRWQAWSRHEPWSKSARMRRLVARGGLVCLSV